ncbi:glutathione S-transferase family protein [Sphingosinicella sp. CPCC 101087]|uniref:glutathione S-transferase family protein n=1 Tax=Sphingosinicella sp. CPCC 101087 TaxID=2497754 RepID=UPI00101BBB85|nr:glutathione S-transferase [Sphingosinicella sp. CPCC 101087]
MTAALYHGEPNGPSLTVLAALFETGAEADLIALDLTQGERHCRAVVGREVEMSIEGEGPVLVVEGEAMADSVFLAQYLDESRGGGLQPADPHARWEMEMWCRFIIERVAPAAAFLGNRAHLTPKLRAMSDEAFEALVGRIASADLAERWRAVREGRYPEAQLEDSRAKIRLAVERLEKRIEGDWILGAFTIADLETYAWLAGMVDLVPEAFADAPITRAWLGRVAARDSVRQALALSPTGVPMKSWAPGPEINRWG